MALTHALTSVWSVNKTDVVNLGSTSGIHNDPEQLLRARVSLVLYLNTKRRSAKSFQRQNNLLFKTQSAPVSLSHIMDASMEDLARCPGIVERKVKCLYDTFHEPFKPVVSRHPPIPETPSLKDVEPSSVNESALSAAFANYADKMGEKKNSSSQKQETETRIPENRSSILAKEAMAAELTHSLTMHIYRLLCPPHLDDVGGVLAITISMDSLKLHS
ncbi:hypothetical protein CISIN_1g041647mg [Citrus sinensis]|uniref:Uncharacterized protein n=1 Tax=Citrus sinensis TaxID=2711 RepID=A0A067F8L1_CITSI|nr:hypothetical protein CISIN_1g041647mg [Citrus sinensis]